MNSTSTRRLPVPDSRYLVRVKAENTRVELRINDVPAVILAPGEAKDGAEVPVNEFLVSGQNTLTLIVHANSLPSRVLDAWTPGPASGVNVGQPATVQATLVMQDGKGDSRAFAPVRMDWSGLAQPMPFQADRQFDVLAQFPVWAWLRARELQPQEAASAAQALRALHGRLAAGDVNGFAAIMDLKLRELTEGGYGVSPAPLRSAFLEGLSRCSSEPGWRLLPCGPADVDLRLVGGRRMAECLRPDGRHALMYENGNGGTFFVPVMLGVVNNSWQVLR